MSANKWRDVADAWLIEAWCFSDALPPEEAAALTNELRRRGLRTSVLTSEDKERDHE